MTDHLLAALDGGYGDHPAAVRVGDEAVSWEALRRRADSVAARISGLPAVAVHAAATMDTVVAVVAGLRAGVPVVPVPHDAGEVERAHVLRDSGAAAVVGGAPWPDHGLPVVPHGAAALGWHRPPPTHTPPASSSTRRAPPVRRRVSCSRTARSPPASTGWPPPGSGLPPTCWSTGCRCSTCMAWCWGCSVRCASAVASCTPVARPRRRMRPPPRRSAAACSSGCRRCGAGWRPMSPRWARCDPLGCWCPGRRRCRCRCSTNWWPAPDRRRWSDTG